MSDFAKEVEGLAIRLTQEQWDEFLKALEDPTKNIDELRELFQRPAVFDKPEDSDAE